MIRRTLAATKAATFCINLPNPDQQGVPTPTGTGFLVSADGWFVTAAHVVQDRNGAVRSDVEDAFLTKQGASGGFEELLQWPEVHSVDAATDLAILKIDFERNSAKEWLKGRESFPHLAMSSRALEEGEPVYAFGYPLPRMQFHEEPGLSVGFTCRGITA